MMRDAGWCIKVNAREGAWMLEKGKVGVECLIDSDLKTGEVVVFFCDSPWRITHLFRSNAKSIKAIFDTYFGLY